MDKKLVKLALATAALLGLVNCAQKSEDSPTVSPSVIGAQAMESMLKTVDDACSVNRGWFGNSPAVAVADGATVSAPIVNGAYTGSNVASLQSSQGNFVFTGSTAGAKINLVSDFSGNLILCNASLGTVSGKVKGNIFVANGTVGDVTGFEGSIIIRNGRVTGRVSGSKALIVQKDGSGAPTATIINQ